MTCEIKGLSARAVKILEAVIEGYLVSGAPVGSKTVTKRCDVSCSSATARGEMAELTEMGYLKQLHVSSGRVPTEKAIRLYLDNFLREDRLSFNEIDRLRTLHPIYGEDFRATVRNAGRILADLTRQTGLVLMTGLRLSPLRRIEFVRLTSKRVMALLINEGGQFITRVFEWGEDLKQHDLTWASNYLNERFVGKTVVQIRETVIREMREEKAEYDRMLAKSLALMQSALQREQSDEEVFVEGMENMVEKPEFAEVDNMFKLFKAFEEKSFIVKLFSKVIEGNDLTVLLSEETGLKDIPALAVIMAGYGGGGPGCGALGIVGPIRMNYARLIPTVRCTANFLSDILAT